MFRTVALSAGMACALAAPVARAAPPTDTETVVFVRHGEKPKGGLGQLNCQGLNRALALGGVISRDFGKPAEIFAPDPAVPKPDHGVDYNYVRPLATIEPTAIAFGLPVNASMGYLDVNGLLQALDSPAARGMVIVVAWEHHEIVSVARNLLVQHGGQPGQVQDWPDNDFDSMYVVRITRDGARFEHLQEGLNGEPETCPAAPAR